MIPEKSSEPVPGQILPPNNRAAKRYEDWEMGGIAIQDPSQGLRVQEWRALWNEETGDVALTAPNQPVPVVIYNEPNLEWLTLAFDQNMRWLSACTLENGQSRLRWYNPLIQDYEVLTLPSGIVTPFLVMDDNRAGPLTLGDSDVILTYLRGGSLWVRVQRERFTVERLIEANVAANRIWHFGMNDGWRLQWELR